LYILNGATLEKIYYAVKEEIKAEIPII